MKPPLNPFFKKIMTTMALSGALLCSFAANAGIASRENLKLKGATLAEPKSNTSLPSEKPTAENSPPVFGPILMPAPPGPAKGTVGNGANGGKSGVGIGNGYSYTPGATAPKSTGVGAYGGTENSVLTAPPPK